MSKKAQQLAALAVTGDSINCCHLFQNASGRRHDTTVWLFKRYLVLVRNWNASSYTTTKLLIIGVNRRPVGPYLNYDVRRL